MFDFHFLIRENIVNCITCYGVGSWGIAEMRWLKFLQSFIQIEDFVNVVSIGTLFCFLSGFSFIDDSQDSSEREATISDTLNHVSPLTNLQIFISYFAFVMITSIFYPHCT